MLSKFIPHYCLHSQFILHNTKNIAYHITEVLIFYADKLMVMGSLKNSRVFNFVKNRENLMLAKYTGWAKKPDHF